MSRPWHICTDPTDVTREAVLDVSFKITSRGYQPDATDPGAPPEFHLTSALDENGIDVLPTLTTEQREIVEDLIATDFDFDLHVRDEREAEL